MPVKIFRGMKRVVRLCDISGQVGGGQAHLLPVTIAERRRQFLAVDANLPRQNAGAFQFCFGKFRDGGLVITRQRIKRKLSIAIEKKEMIAVFGLRILLKPIQRFRDVASQPVAIGRKITMDFRGKGINRLIRDQAFRICAPCACGQREDENGNCRRHASSDAMGNEAFALAHHRSATPDSCRNVLRLRL